jgi:hypothetical protein
MSSLGEDNAGQIYVLTERGPTGGKGAVYRLTPFRKEI